MALPRTRVVQQALPPSLLSAVRREALAAHNYVTKPHSSAVSRSRDDGPAATFWCPSAKLTAPISNEKTSAIEQALGTLLRLAIANDAYDAKINGEGDGDTHNFIVEGGEWWGQQCTSHCDAHCCGWHFPFAAAGLPKMCRGAIRWLCEFAVVDQTW